jgi:formylmethanofuran dehydrogenase subunit A
MLTLLSGGRVIDPTQDRDAVGDVWIEDGRIVAAPERPADSVLDCSGRIVMAGGIDIHSHIAGANVNTARLLLPQLQGSPAAAAVPPAGLIGQLYAAMGYTLVVEPAISPQVAVQAHQELSAIPAIDTAILTVLGNEDFLLRLLQRGEGADAVADYAGRALAGAGGLGIKVINPGSAAAFKLNARAFGLDDAVPGSDVTARAIIEAAQQAREQLGVPHPVHLHCANLGIPGNVETALATIAAAGHHPLHLAHLQFYAYGTEGARTFSSAAARLAEALNAAPAHVTADVGQVMFGQTVTVSSDVLRQFGARASGHPKTWSIAERDGNGGGVIPYRYRRNSFANAVQWAAGLELFLLNRDPWRLFFTTDHPNGAPFTAYPDLLALLMSASLRDAWCETLPREALEMTTLPSLRREYSLSEIAIMTRAAPARLLGLPDRGHLRPGARADIAVYRPAEDKAAMFRDAAIVLKDGRPISRDGALLDHAPGRVLRVEPGFDAAIDQRLAAYYDDVFGVPHTLFDVPARAARFESVRCPT